MLTVSFNSYVTSYTNGDKFYSPVKCETTLRDVLSEMYEHYGQQFESFVNGNETCLILINGKGTALSGGLDSPLGEGDKIDILPFVGAG